MKGLRVVSSSSDIDQLTNELGNLKKYFGSILEHCKKKNEISSDMKFQIKDVT